MTNRDRYKLLGTYRTPRVRIGSVLPCEYRDDDVMVVGYSDSKIPWHPRPPALGLFRSIPRRTTSLPVG
jgi:hypothetical protein